MLSVNWEILSAAPLNFPFIDCVGVKKIFGERIVTENLKKHRLWVGKKTR